MRSVALGMFIAIIFSINAYFIGRYLSKISRDKALKPGDSRYISHKCLAWTPAHERTDVLRCRNGGREQRRAALLACLALPCLALPLVGASRGSVRTRVRFLLVAWERVRGGFWTRSVRPWNAARSCHCRRHTRVRDADRCCADRIGIGAHRRTRSTRAGSSCHVTYVRSAPAVAGCGRQRC